VRGSSIRRPQSPTIEIPQVPHFRPHQGTIPEDGIPPGVPTWPMFGPPDMPSPVWTEHSSQHAPEGLLDPKLGMRLGMAGMESSAAISLRDDVDYSRPIGALVNNRMYSSTTLKTMET
ncbi:hypothetical protein K474DRAFT_1563868, partial [Panus rudis PR-1116 ss-1]